MNSNAQKVPAYVWAVVALLWPVVVLNYLDRQMLATMGLSIKADIVELQSARNFGWLMAIFLWVYAFCSPVGGAIADRLSRKWLIIASLGVWPSVTLLMGQAANFDQLFALRAIRGWVAQEVSWRAWFAACGAIRVAYALLLMIFLRDTDRGNPG